MTRPLALSAIAAVLALTFLLSGCGGGGGGGENPPPPVGNTATVRGMVVQADNPAIGLGGASVQALGFASSVASAQTTVLAQTTADAQGNFVLANVPVGVVTILVDTTNEAAYGSQSISGLELSAGDDVRLTVTVLPVGEAAPALLYLTPNNATIDPGGIVRFSASVTSSSGLLDLTPSFLLSGDVGVVNAEGEFVAGSPGDGHLVAVCGTARATADIHVTEPRAPEITTFLVAPLSLPATGGSTTITVAANDGDGITQVEAEVYGPGGDVDTAPLPPVSGTLETYRLNYPLPPNSNIPDATGHQAEQKYSIRVKATDGSGAQTTTDFVDVKVVGIDTPPPPI